MKTRNTVLRAFEKIKSKYFLIMCIAGTITLSCDKTLLEEPEYSVEAAQIFSTEERAELVLQGALSQLENGYWSNQGYHQLTAPAGGFLHRPGGGVIEEYNNFIFKENHPWPQYIWDVNYNVIYALNVIISYFEDNYESFDALTPGYKNVLGKAYFLRAYQYFKLVRLWGDIPMPLEPAVEITHTPLSNEVDVYASVIKDFEQAKTLLPEGDGIPKKYQGPIKTATDAFLAKVYATQAGWLNAPQLWEKAKNHADIVINSGDYMLLEDISKLHSLAGRNSEEAIFELQANTEVNLNNLSQAYNPVGIETDLWGGYIRVQPWMWYQQVGDDMYSDHTRSAINNKITAIRDHDPRVDITYIDSTYTKTNGMVVKIYPRAKWSNGYYLYSAKYLDPNRTSNASMRNWKILRYADVLLLRAEIENELNGPTNAYQYVNQVLDRARNNGQGIYPLSWNGTNVPNTDDFRKKIAWERMYELIGEGHGFFEARRRGLDFLVNDFLIPVHNNFDDPVLAVSIRTKATDEGIMHLKIPVGETSSNNSID